MRLRTLAIIGMAIALPGCGGKGSTQPGLPTEPPVLASINGATQPSGPIGSTVILEGQHFGAIRGTAQVLFTATGGTVAATIASTADWTDGYIITTVPTGAVTGPVRVVTRIAASNAITFTITQSAAFNPSTISWTATTSLPTALSGARAAFATVRATDTTNVVYVAGGADTLGSPQGEVLYSVVQPGGQLGVWTPTTPLPVSIAFHATAIATPSNSRLEGVGMLYVIGGATDSTGSSTSLVYRAGINSGGSIGIWTAAAALPVPLHSMGAVIFSGDLYVVGGATTGNAPSAAVYRARIQADGSLSNWVAQSALPSARAYHAITAFGGYLYAFGGETGVVSPSDPNVTNNASKLSDVIVARVYLPTRDLQAWAPVGSLIKAVSKHTAVAAGGYVLVSGGLYNGATTGSTEESYAQFLSSGGIGSFSGATGSHTIASAGGGNLFNHAALSYEDPSGVPHVLVIGGDDVNTPGTKHREVWFN